MLLVKASNAEERSVPSRRVLASISKSVSPGVSPGVYIGRLRLDVAKPFTGSDRCSPHLLGKRRSYL